MNREATYARLDRVFMLIAAVWFLACAALIAVNLIRSPLAERRRDLEERLAALHYVDESFAAASDTDYEKLRETILGKQPLWNDLVAPPPPPAPEVKGPNLDELIKGINPSAREQLGTAAGGLKVRIRTEARQDGEWKGVGDKVNGLLIKSISPTEVVFTTNIRGQDYDIPVKRN